MDDVAALRPTLFIAVPRILERVEDGGGRRCCTLVLFGFASAGKGVAPWSAWRTGVGQLLHSCLVWLCFCWQGWSRRTLERVEDGGWAAASELTLPAVRVAWRPSL